MISRDIKLTELQQKVLRAVAILVRKGEDPVRHWRICIAVNYELNPIRNRWPRRYVSVYRVLQALERRGFLVRTESDGNTFWGLGPLTDLMQDMGIWDALVGVMRRVT